MLSDNLGQAQNPEKSKQTDEKGEQKTVVAPETASGFIRPQPPQPSDDQKTVKDVKNDLQNAQQKPQTKSSDDASNSQKATPGIGSDEPYIKAAEDVIEKDKNDPYQEEEDHEDIQIQYLKDRFGKDIKKN